MDVYRVGPGETTSDVDGALANIDILAVLLNDDATLYVDLTSVDDVVILNDALSKTYTLAQRLSIGKLVVSYRVTAGISVITQKGGVRHIDGGAIVETYSNVYENLRVATVY